MAAIPVRKILSFTLVIAVAGFALLYALWDVDYKELGRLLSGGDYLILAPFLLLLGFFYWIKAYRWVLILEPIGRFTPSKVMPSMMIGFAGNNILPAHLGELIRIGVFSHHFRKPISSVTITIMVERVFDLIGILSLYAIGIAVIGMPPESIRAAAWIFTLIAVTFFLIIVFILWKPELVKNLGNRMGNMLPRVSGDRFKDILANVIVAFSALRSPRVVTVMTFWSVTKWALMTGMVWLSLLAFGVVVEPAVTVIVMVVVALAVAVPNAPGYIGAIQAAFVFALRPFGVSDELAFAASVFFLVGQWIPVTAVGTAYFIAGGMHVSDVRKEVEEVIEEETRGK